MVRWFRITARPFSLSPPVTISPMRNSPSVGRSRRPIRFINVDLPEPDGPTIETYSPASMTKDTGASAVTMPAPAP
jgi:hypothetical protein